jgi:hypothetical protein
MGGSLSSVVALIHPSHFGLNALGESVFCGQLSNLLAFFRWGDVGAPHDAVGRVFEGAHLGGFLGESGKATLRNLDDAFEICVN